MIQSGQKGKKLRRKIWTGWTTWIELRLMNAKIKNAPDTMTSWARPRKKYFFLRVLAATQGHIRQTFNTLLSGIRFIWSNTPQSERKKYFFLRYYRWVRMKRKHGKLMQIYTNTKLYIIQVKLVWDLSFVLRWMV